MGKIFTIVLLFGAIAVKPAGNLTGGVVSPVFAVNFDYKSYELNAANQRHLDSLIYLMQHETLIIQKIEIKGHCDSIGSNAYNDTLSLRRAQAVRNYFIVHGVNDSLIKNITGYGKRQPLNNNLDSLKRLANRRVEIVFQMVIPPVKDTVKQITPTKAAILTSDSSDLPTIDISHTEVNDVLQLHNINFYPDEHMIVEDSKVYLRTLLNTMRVNKTLRIQIRGHVCCIPESQGDAMDADTYTENLSLNRAKEIYLYLTENGIEPDRMTYIGLGASEPLVKEFTNADKAKNRRVEIKILSK
jgi:outer membrane protein OmpA-like peptidoglycan-associated protein